MAPRTVTILDRLGLSGQAEVIDKLLRYLLVGGVCALTDWAVFSLLVFGAGTPFLLGATLSFVLATLLNYVLGLRYVFSGGRHARHLEVSYVYLASLLALGINLIILYLVHTLLGWHLLAAKILGTGGAFLWNFAIRYLWIFQRGAPASDPGN